MKERKGLRMNKTIDKRERKKERLIEGKKEKMDKKDKKKERKN